MQNWSSRLFCIVVGLLSDMRDSWQLLVLLAQLKLSEPLALTELSETVGSVGTVGTVGALRTGTFKSVGTFGLEQWGLLVQ
jgi:hypothetical protein